MFLVKTKKVINSQIFNNYTSNHIFLLTLRPLEKPYRTFLMDFYL